MEEYKCIMIILVSHRSKSAVEVQRLLTEWGCSIKTRLGIHDGVGDRCTDTGLIILELVGDKKTKDDLDQKLSALDGVSTKLVEMRV
ncbi:MAG TPA: hypothetical protein VF857_06890 [Spirochaetota bacterium]